MQSNHPSRLVHLGAVLIAATAIVGYFVGLQSPMNPADKMARHQRERTPAKLRLEHSEAGAIPATSYAEIGNAVLALAPQPDFSQIDVARATVGTQISTEISTESEQPPVSLAEKQFALAMRQKNRAYNGAPPTVPHPISEMSAEACAACHVHGLQSTTLRIPKMSHQFLANCTQCHVGTASPDMPNAMPRANLFVGMPAPQGGPRAYPGAPPQIPHSTWMRVDCLSCHGASSFRGLQTTHPWRTNCQQCHAPSSTAEQTLLESDAKFLSPPPVERMTGRSLHSH